MEEENNDVVISVINTRISCRVQLSRKSLRKVIFVELNVLCIMNHRANQNWMAGGRKWTGEKGGGS